VDYDLYGRLDGKVSIFWEPLGGNINFLQAIFGSSFNPLPGVSADFDLFSVSTPIFTGGHIGCDGGKPPIVYFAPNPSTPTNGPLPVTVFFDAEGKNDAYTDRPGTDFSIDPDGGKLARFFWDFDGDGMCEQETGDVGQANHTYTAYGDYDISVWVVDDDGMVTKKTIPLTIAP
jgi:hypothetical protein